MVSLKIQLLATILLISEVYCQLTGCGCGAIPRCGPPTVTQTGSIIPAGQFIVPAIIKPLISPCLPPAQPAPGPAKNPVPAVPGAPAPCADGDEDSQLDRLLYLLISNIIDSRKGCGKKPGYSSSIISDGSESSDCGYADEYDYVQPSAYSPPVSYCTGADQGYSISSCDTNYPEISLCIKPCYE